MPMYNAEYTIQYSTIVDPVTNRETSMLGLRLPLTNEHFYRGRVKVSFEIKKFLAYWKMFPVHTLSFAYFSSMEKIQLDGSKFLENLLDLLMKIPASMANLSPVWG